MTAMATDATNKTDLYWEARGSGPAILLIAGTPGDGGQFEALVDELCADQYRSVLGVASVAMAVT